MRRLERRLGNGVTAGHDDGVRRRGARRGTGGACRRHEVPGRGGWSKTRGAEAVLAGARRTWPAARDGAVPDVRRRANAVRKREW